MKHDPHCKSIDRAHLINSANALLVAHEQLRQHGAITNASAYTRFYRFTSQVTVDGTEHLAELAAGVPGLTNAGPLVAATRTWFSNGIMLVRPTLASYRLSGSEKQTPINRTCHLNQKGT